MKEAIKQNLENPAQLESMYQNHKKEFKEEFNLVYSEIQNNKTAQVWNARLNYEQEKITWGASNELLVVIILSLIAGLIAKLPDFVGINPDFFYPRNIAFAVFPILTIYFGWKYKIQNKILGIAIGGILLSALFINLLPINQESDTLFLASIHLPLFLWVMLGITFLGHKINNHKRRLDFITYNGDLVVMTTLILISGGLFTAITLGLFGLIGLHIEDFYFEYIAIWGAAAAPLVATFLIQTNPQLVNKVSPIIAKIFTPIVLVMLSIYLGAVLYTGQSPYDDREFLLIFNILLIGVMAIILFSIAEISNEETHKIHIYMLFGLACVTIILNGIALSAILFRISEWGFTPNRTAVLGSNVLILGNLLFVSLGIFRMLKSGDDSEGVEKIITSFLPVYLAWISIVIFVFPFLFGFQ